MVMQDSKLEVWDFVVIALYFVAVLGAGIWSMCRSNRGTVSGYFLAGRFMIWLPVGASIFASNIGSEHFIGLAGSGAAAGIAVGAFELNAAIILQILGWIFLPVYIASGVCTLPEFMKKRFGGTRIRIYLASLSLVLYILTKISVNLYSGALFIQQALNWDLYISVLGLLAVTAFLTVTGGLAAVIYTDTLQAFVMVIGACMLTVIAFFRVGGYETLYNSYMLAVPNTTLANPNTTCGYPREDSWTMWRDPLTGDIPWPAFLLGQTPASIWYWCADQMMVQRTLAAKSLSHAQGGTLFAGFIKLLPVFIMVIPGMVARVLFTDEIACADPDVCFSVCQSRVSCTNIAYPKLVLEILPAGLKGLMLSVMLAALMSDLTSIFNSASTLFTIDVYMRIRKKAKNKELMIVGRLFVCLMVAVGILWIPVIQSNQGGQLFIYIQVISAYLAPPIAAVYILAILWKRCNEQGAFWGLMVGMVIGVTRMILEFVYDEPSCGEVDMRPAVLSKVHYMYFAMLLFWATGIVVVVISLITKPPPPAMVSRTTYYTRFDRPTTDITLTEPTKEISTEIAEPFIMKTNGDYIERGDASERKVDEENGTINQRANSTNYSTGDNTVNDTDNRHTDRQRREDTEHLTDDKESIVVPWWKRAYVWFCGFESEEKQHQNEERMSKICSLKQDPRAKILLNVLLVVVIALDVIVFVIFSTGSDFFGLIKTWDNVTISAYENSKYNGTFPYL